MSSVEGTAAEWVDLVRAEYFEMPGLSLTREQMCRLWRFDATVCDAVVEALVASSFLRRRPDDSYVRRDAGL